MKRKYRIKEVTEFDGDAPQFLMTYYVVQVRRWFGWVTPERIFCSLMTPDLGRRFAES